MNFYEKTQPLPPSPEKSNGDPEKLKKLFSLTTSLDDFETVINSRSVEELQHLLVVGDTVQKELQKRMTIDNIHLLPMPERLALANTLRNVYKKHIAITNRLIELRENQASS